MTKNDFIRWLAEVKEHAKKARPNETGVLVPFEADGRAFFCLQSVTRNGIIISAYASYKRNKPPA